MEQCTLVKDMLCNDIAKHCDQVTCKKLMSTCKELREYESNHILYPYYDLDTILEKDLVISFKKYYSYYDISLPSYIDDETNHSDYDNHFHSINMEVICYNIGKLHAKNILKYLYELCDTLIDYINILFGAITIPHNDEFVKYILNLAEKSTFGIDCFHFPRYYDDDDIVYSLEDLADNYNYNLYSHIHSLYQE